MFTDNIYNSVADVQEVQELPVQSEIIHMNSKSSFGIADTPYSFVFLWPPIELAYRLQIEEVNYMVQSNNSDCYDKLQVIFDLLGRRS